MDWGTHPVLAAKILKSCNLDKGAAIYSNLPALDSKPAHYHRVYAHILVNQESILDAAIEVFGSDEMARRDFKNLEERFTVTIDGLKEQLSRAVSPDDKSQLERGIYAYTRLTEEAKVFVAHTDEAANLLRDSSISKVSSDKMSAAVSMISHIYFDTFNNPVQIFLPYSSLPSGQWYLWDNTDYMRFRAEFYNEASIIPFRREIIKSKVWNVKMTPPALIKAMIIRVGELSQPAIKYEVIDWSIRKFLRYMDVDRYYRADVELKFCRDIEAEITRIIMAKFGKKSTAA